jgi:Tol biopolymer transport system component/DNA-binding winged helix-turn-helix (wHTH) protein
MDSVNTYSYIFEDFLVDSDSLTVYRGGRKIDLNRLNRTRIEVLISLLEKAGEVVTKEEIIARVWPDQINQPNSEANLSQQIFHLRRFFHDNPGSPRYILTIPGTGYIFYPQVQVVIKADNHKQNQTPPVAKMTESDRSDFATGATASPDETFLTEVTAGVAGREIAWESARPSPVHVHIPANRAPRDRSIIPTLGGLISNLVRLVILAGMILLCGTMIKFWFERGVEGRVIKESTITPLISRPGWKEGLAYSRDGQVLAFLAEGRINDTIDLFIKRSGSNDIIQLTDNPSLEKMLTWSPDNQQIAFLRQTNDDVRKYSIFTVSVFGGPERLIGSAIDGLDWDPTGRYLAISDDEGAGTPTGIYLLSLDGRERRAISNPTPGTNIFDSRPRFSPDGQQIVFTRWTSNTKGDLFVVDLQTGQLRQLTHDHDGAQSPQWSRNGQEILFISNRNGNSRIWRISKNGGLSRLVESIVGEVADFSLSPTTEEIAFIERFDECDLQVHWVTDAGDEEPAEVPCTANSTRPDHSPHFSPDGKRIVFMSKRTGVDEIWITDADCQKARQLTNFRTYGVGSPRWSPDGEQIVFDFFSNNQSDIYKVDLIGGQTTRLTEDSASDFLPSWSQDGRWIYFTSKRPGQNPGNQVCQDCQICQVWKMRADGGELQQVTEFGGKEPFQSFDGSTLYYIRDSKIWTKDLPSGRETRLEALSNYQVDRYWSLNRQAIFFLAPVDSTSSRIFRLDLQPRQIEGRFNPTIGPPIKAVHELSGSRVGHVSGLSISPDERRLVTSLSDKSFSNISVISNW